MNDLPEDLFANPVWHALKSRHGHLALRAGEACRYPADVAPFAAVATPSKSALQDLSSILAPNEKVWLVGNHNPQVPELRIEGTLPCLQMVLPGNVPIARPAKDIARLAKVHAHEMVALTNLAFPGFFRPRTCEMGAYFGVRLNGELIAMAGERLVLDGYPEISGVCTHPAHRGKGLASSLIWRLARRHRRHGLVTWLHVGSANTDAINLYLKTGFKVIREVVLTKVSMRTMV